MTTWVSGGICMSRSSLRLGASEDESDALFGKGSGSRGRLKRSRLRTSHLRSSHLRKSRLRLARGRKYAEQAVALEAIDGHRQYLSDEIGGRHHMRRLQI